MADSTLTFKHFELHEWRQFRNVSLDFHPQLTVLTGENGTGKTTLLNLLSPHFAWQIQFAAVPRRWRDGSLHYDSGLRSQTDASPGVSDSVGTLEYSDGSSSHLMIPHETGTSFVPSWSGMGLVPGLNIPSHRAVQSYQPVQTLPAHFSASAALLEQFLNEIRQRYAGGYTGKSAATWMKESLIAAAIFGEGNESVAPNPEARDVWEGFQGVLKRLLPESLGFLHLRVEAPDLLVQTRGGPFVLDAASGGISALFELGWQIFLRAREYETFTVCYDEPENHLHPSLQKTLMPSLIEAFPGVRFIVATHSPFVVTSVKDANVYVLEYGDGAIETTLLDTTAKARTADETLRRVLGLDSTLPLWADHQLSDIVDRYSRRDLNPQVLEELRSELTAVGLADQFPVAAAVLAGLSIDETTN